MKSVKHWLSHYPFMISLDRGGGSCNTLDDLSSRVCILNKTEDLKLNVFDIITEINVDASKTLKTYFR